MLRRKHRGSGGVILLIGVIFFWMLISALAVDLAFVFAVQNRLQTAADAAALAAAQEFYETHAENRQSRAFLIAADSVDRNLTGASAAPLKEEDVIFGYVDPQTMIFNPDTFRAGGDDPQFQFLGNYNAVMVMVRRTKGSKAGELPTLFARIAGLKSMPTAAYAVAVIDDRVGRVNKGIRPFYACKSLYDMAMADGDATNNVIKIYGQQFMIDGNTNIPNCPSAGFGDMGFANFEGDVNVSTDSENATENQVAGSWIDAGYPKAILSDTIYNTQTSHFLETPVAQSALERLRHDGTVLMIPLIDTMKGRGRTTKVHVAGFASFVITNYDAGNNVQDRYIQGYFTQSVCTMACQSGGKYASGSLVKIRLATEKILF